MIGKLLSIYRQIFILILISFLITMLFLGCNKTKPPSIGLSEGKWHFGEVHPEEKPSHHFMIRNNGEEKLIIESVYSSCACVELLLTEKEVAPGEEATLTATFDPYGYEGEVTKYITVKSNDPENPEKRIGLSITVQHVPSPDVVLSQQSFELGEILLAEQGKQTIQFTIFNKGEADLLIEDIIMEKIFSHGLKVPIRILPEEQFQVKLFIDVTQLEKGEFRKAVRIMTNDPQNPAVFLRILGIFQ
jgi:hypothetical protein